MKLEKIEYQDNCSKIDIKFLIFKQFKLETQSNIIKKMATKLQ